MSVSIDDEKMQGVLATPKSPSFFELSKYERLNRSVLHYLPEKTVEFTQKNTPSLIIICGWMAATPRHMSKYTAGYSALYPHARIMVVTTTPWDMIPIESISGGTKRIQPVLDICYGLKSDDSILIHMMSNGGMRSSNLIGSEFKKHTGRSLPIGAIVDSAPGKATWDASISAFKVSNYRNPIAIFIRNCVIYFLFSIYCCVFFILNCPDTVDQDRTELNNPEVFQIHAPRLYIYGDCDNIVDWRDVEEHMNEAEITGYKVVGEKFIGGSHVSHLLSNGNKYWKTIQNIWDLKR